jgi:hypothetical protein
VKYLSKFQFYKKYGNTATFYRKYGGVLCIAIEELQYKRPIKVFYSP